MLPGPASIREKLLAAIRFDTDELWSIFGVLLRMDEAAKGCLLRTSAEGAFDLYRDGEVMCRRLRFDSALDSLMLFEVGRQTRILTGTDAIPDAIAHDLKALFKSEAVLRYANAYLYFGVRFLAGRIDAPEWLKPDTVSTGKWATCISRSDTDCKNSRPLALARPPAIHTPEDDPCAALWAETRGHPTGDAGKFLDRFFQSDEEPDAFERWLRGLSPETDSVVSARFESIAAGIAAWAIERSRFYLRLDPEPLPRPSLVERRMENEPPERPLGGWAIANPVAARYGLLDVYWFANALRADVTASAAVSYPHHSWLRLLASRADRHGNQALNAGLLKAEEILRSVFDRTCELVQNAVEITEERERLWFSPERRAKAPAVGWRKVFDDELSAIVRQRTMRNYTVQPPLPYANSEELEGWSRRVSAGGEPTNLIGLAFSGGGIRSATFNLGVLQALQEYDLLRHVDYLSTVSGGGFIGAWLVGNVNRSLFWLGRLTNWEGSVAHLRRYSNFLTPLSGILSADTWTMWAIWFRNAILIQTSAIAWLVAMLMAALAGQSVFEKAGGMPGVFHHKPIDVISLPGYVLIGLSLLLIAAEVLNLKGGASISRFTFASRFVRRLCVFPAWLACFITAALLWGDATGRSTMSGPFIGIHHYSEILGAAWRPWEPMLLFWTIGLAVIAGITMFRHRWHVLWIGPLSTGILYLQLCGIMWLFLKWAQYPHQFNWYAYVLGPTLLLAANTVTIIFFIGFCGRHSREWIREWWTRFGAWLVIYGAGYLVLSATAVFGPLWIAMVLEAKWPAVKWGAVAAWAGTTLGGLLAGRSSKTSGNGEAGKSPALEILAKTGGLIFIAGGMLAVSWVLQLLLVNIASDDTLSRDGYWQVLNQVATMVYTIHSRDIGLLLLALTAALGLGFLFSWFFEINIFGLNQFYRNRLIRCYLGATRWIPGLRKPQPFTGFDGQDDVPLGNLAKDRGPFPIVNCTLNLGGSSDLALHTRRSASFTLTPLHCGSDRTAVGYAPTGDSDSKKSFSGGVMLGQAIAVSGAAASPNMGYNTSPLVAFLLTMFNVRLGWWFPNPGRSRWHSRSLRLSLYYLVKELLGLADETNLFVNVSDGGHFENLGVYELVRRRCKIIVASDAECDEVLQFGSLGNLVRVCETDFDAKIDIDVNSIRTVKEGYSLAHCTVGKITYSNGSIGYLFYLKASVTGDESVGIAQYRSVHPSFPHETTADQFFSEDQFESYRLLGAHVVAHALRGSRVGEHPVSLVEKLFDVWAPAGFTSDIFLKHTKAIDVLWERFRQAPSLHRFADQLAARDTHGSRLRMPPTTEESCAALEVLQLMENVFLDLRLEDFWDHPDNRGWVMTFLSWARSPLLRAVWTDSRRMFGIRFEYFCEERLGLPRDMPIARV